MIRYTLRCTNEHAFDSWFRSAQDFDTLSAAGQIACPDCGATDVTKAPMAPGVAASKNEASEHPAARLRRRFEAEADYVGDAFPTVARAIHEGEAPDRPIWGEAKPAEARALAEDGVPIAPLPFIPKRKTN